MVLQLVGVEQRVFKLITHPNGFVKDYVEVVTAVAPVTIGTLRMGSFESACGATSHSIDVHWRTMALLPSKIVSECESISILPYVAVDCGI